MNRFSIPAALVCGATLVLAAAQAMAGEFRVELRAASDDTMTGLPSCRIDYTASNTLDVPVRRGSFRVLPVAIDGTSTAGSAAASGESLANIGPVGIGEHAEHSFKVRGAPCKNLSGLKLVAFYCVREPDKGNCSSQMVINSDLQKLALIMP